MILGQQKIHGPGALAPGGERPSTGLAIPPPTDGLWSFCWPPPAKGLAPEWVVRGGLGGRRTARSISAGAEGRRPFVEMDFPNWEKLVSQESDVMRRTHHAMPGQQCSKTPMQRYSITA